MKILKTSLLALAILALGACTENTSDTDQMEIDTDGDGEMEMVTISDDTRQKSADIGIGINEEKDMDGDGIADVRFTYDGALIDLRRDNHTEMDDGEVEIDRDKTYSLEWDEEDQKWEIDTENEFEQSYEKAGKAIKNTAKDVGDAVGDVFDGDDND